MIKKKITSNPVFLSILIHVIAISIFISFYSIKAKEKNTGVIINNISIEGDPTKIIGKHGSYKTTGFKKQTAGIETNKDSSINKTNSTDSTGQDGGTGLGKSDNYTGSILRKIHNNKNYPPQAKRMKQEGTSTVSFILKNTGSLEKALISKTSGHKLLDSSAINTITRSAPYPPFPKTITAKQLELNVDIEFIL